MVHRESESRPTNFKSSLTVALVGEKLVYTTVTSIVLFVCLCCRLLNSTGKAFWAIQ